jgi:membrane associated rhomboid family serine protease
LQEKKLIDHLFVPLAFIGLIWIIFLLQNLFGYSPGRLGVLPREVRGLWGILFSPLLHGSLDHIISNSIPFLVLSTSLFYFYEKVAVRSFVMIYFLSGIALWFLGNLFFCGTEFNRTCYLPHIGASGVVYGLLAFLFWSGIFRRSLQSIVLALIVTMLYSGYFAGIAPNPNEGNVSWEGHLLGAIMGIFTAFYFKDELEESEVESMRNIYADENTEKITQFLPADIFEKTKLQRAQEAAARLAAERAAREGLDPWTSDDTFS